MSRRESNISRRLVLAVTLAAMAMTLAMTAGMAFGRYRTELDRVSMLFQTKRSYYIYLNGPERADGGYDPLPGNWELTQHRGELEFTVANGAQQEEFPDVDMSFQVSILLTQAVEEDFVLQLETGDAVYEGRVTPIEPGSPAYAQVGQGWIYRFYDEKGREFTGLLEGEKHSAFSATLVCQGTLTQAELTMLQMQITAVDTN